MINVDYFLLIIFAFILFFTLIYTKKYSSNRNITVLLSLLTIFSGLSFVLLPNKISPLFGILLFIIGSYFYITHSPDLGLRFSNFKKLPKYSPYFGICIIIVIIVYTYMYGDRSLGSLDRSILLMGFSWVIFNKVPYDYSKIRDFIFIFINIFTLLVLLPYFVNLLFSNQDTFSDIFITKFLAIPLSFFLNIIGFESSAVEELLYYKDINGEYKSVSIAWVCSGIQSLIVFLSAFLSYVITEYRRLNSVMINFVLFGILVSYFANILRMVIIVLAGHYYGSDALYWTHTNIGWVIFTIWFGIFWHYSIKIIESSLIDENKNRI